jgi:hypothetical protein
MTAAPIPSRGDEWVYERIREVCGDPTYREHVSRVRQAIADGTYVGTPITDEDLRRLRTEAQGSS